MAYIRTAHPDWARPVLESLAAQNDKEALYPYWLGRLDYDGHQYNNAIRHFQHAIELNPNMARAYDNLGLCYYYQNQNDQAVTNYEKAIELGRESAQSFSLAVSEPRHHAAIPEPRRRCREESSRSDSPGPDIRQGAFPAWNCP